MKCVWGDIRFQEQREKDMAALNKANNEIQSLQEAVQAAQALALASEARGNRRTTIAFMCLNLDREP